MDTNTEGAVSEYTQMVRAFSFDSNTSVNDDKSRRGIGKVRFTGIKVADIGGQEKHTFNLGDTIRFVLRFKVFEPVRDLCGSVALRSEKTREIITSARHIVADESLPVGYDGEFIIEFPHNNLRPREYPLYFWLGSKDFKPYDVVDDVVAPLVITTNLDDVQLGYFTSDVPGYFDIKSNLIGESKC